MRSRQIHTCNVIAFPSQILDFATCLNYASRSSKSAGIVRTSTTPSQSKLSNFGSGVGLPTPPAAAAPTGTFR